MAPLALAIVLAVVVLDVVIRSRWSHTPETAANSVEAAESSTASDGTYPLDDGP